MNWYLVCGNKSPNGVPSSDMKARIHKLCQVLTYEDDPAVIILSGANGEAEMMVELLKEGINSRVLEMHDILMDKDAKTTVHHFDILEPFEVDCATIITSDYHVKRTKLISRRLNRHDEVIGAPTTIDKGRKEIIDKILYFWMYLFWHP